MTVSLKFDFLGYRIATVRLNIDEPQPWVIERPTGTILGGHIKTETVPKWRTLLRRAIKKTSTSWVGEMAA